MARISSKVPEKVQNKESWTSRLCTIDGSNTALITNRPELSVSRGFLGWCQILCETMKLTNSDRILFAQSLQSLCEDRGVTATITTISDNDFLRLGKMISLALTAQDRPAPSEIVGGDDPNSLGNVIVRRRHQLAYSIKLSNLARDPIISSGALSISCFGAFYAPEAMQNLPPTFPGFLIGLTFTVLRAFAHPVGYGEAALCTRLINYARKKASLMKRIFEVSGNPL